MMLTDLADVLRAGGLTVVEEDGWERRGHGPMKAVLGVTCHHTANGGAKGDEPSRAVVRDGRPGLDGPLAQLLLRKDGVYRVIAAGRCWHAGDSLTVSQGNSFRIGIEAEAKGVPGTVGDWPEVQIAAFARGCKVLATHYGFNTDQVLGHKETCSPPRRKSDPDFDMDKFRARVRAVNLKPTKQEDDMLAKEDITKIADAVVNYSIPNLNPPGSTASKDSTLKGSIVDIERTQDVHTGTLGEHTATLAAVRTDISSTRADVSAVKVQIAELRTLLLQLVERDQPGE